MNSKAITLLIRKDLYLARWILLGILVVYPLFLSRCTFRTFPSLPARRLEIPIWLQTYTFYISVPIVLAVGLAVAIQTILRERVEKANVFAMSLPITPKEYYVSKSLVNGSIVGTAWLVMFVGMLAMVMIRDDLSNGFIPLVTLISVQSLAGLILLVAIAMVVRTSNWVFMPFVAVSVYFAQFSGRLFDKLGITVEVRSDSITWPTPLLEMLLVTILLIGLIVFITRCLMRKRDII